MHVLFLHHNFPAQFGQIAAHLVKHQGCRCTFASEKDAHSTPEIEHIRFVTSGGARQETHYCSRTFENQIARSQAVFDCLRQRPDIQPDLIVAHSGFVSPLFLRELFPHVPQMGYFEYFYHAHGSDMDFRHDLPAAPVMDFFRVRARNAMLLLDLHNCEAGYSPTEFQRAQLPAEYQNKVRVIFDGIDTHFWRRVASPTRQVGAVSIPREHRVITYVSRGFESLRGFDIFLQVADRLCRRRADVSVLVVGEDRVAYGGDLRFTGGKSFKEWALARHQPDLSRIHFVGRLPPSQLVHVLSLSDLHFYLTAPFVLSWSLMNALACGATVLASDTAPVREMIRHEMNGLLVDFFDVDGFVAAASRVLDAPREFQSLGEQGARMIRESYSLEKCLPRMLALYKQVLGRD